MIQKYVLIQNMIIVQIINIYLQQIGNKLKNILMLGCINYYEDNYEKKIDY